MIYIDIPACRTGELNLWDVLEYFLDELTSFFLNISSWEESLSLFLGLAFTLLLVGMFPLEELLLRFVPLPAFFFKGFFSLTYK